MINYDYITKENIIEHKKNWPQIADHLHRKLITGGSGSGKTNALLNLIKSKMMMIILLIKIIYMLRIQMKQNINTSLKR